MVFATKSLLIVTIVDEEGDVVSRLLHGSLLHLVKFVDIPTTLPLNAVVILISPSPLGQIGLMMFIRIHALINELLSNLRLNYHYLDHLPHIPDMNGTLIVVQVITSLRI